MSLSEDIKRIERFFGKKYRVELVEMCHDGECTARKIYVNKALSHENKLKTIIHEYIHIAWGVCHGPQARKAGYNSVNRDYFSDIIYTVIFPRRASSTARWKK